MSAGAAPPLQCGFIEIPTGAACVLPKGHTGSHGGPLPSASPSECGQADQITGATCLRVKGHAGLHGGPPSSAPPPAAVKPTTIDPLVQTLVALAEKHPRAAAFAAGFGLALLVNSIGRKDGD